jgi:hypothetical protein
MAIFKTTDEGVNWSRTYLSMEAGQVSSVEPQPSNKNVVLAGATISIVHRFSRLYRSTDAGGHGRRWGFYSTTNEYLNAIAYPITANRVLAATSNGVMSAPMQGGLVAASSVWRTISRDPPRESFISIISGVPEHKWGTSYSDE